LLPTLREDFKFTLPTLKEGASHSEGRLLLPTLREDFYIYTSHSEGRLGELLRRPSQSIYQGWRCGARGSFIFVLLVGEFCLHDRRKNAERVIYMKKGEGASLKTPALAGEKRATLTLYY
jgi:hypothetical protein